MKYKFIIGTPNCGESCEPNIKKQEAALKNEMDKYPLKQKKK